MVRWQDTVVSYTSPTKQGDKLSDPVERISPETTAPDEVLRAKLEELLPGVIVEGNLDAHRLADLLNVNIDGITERPERFGLNWAGKKSAIKALRTPSMASLAPDMENSINWDTAENVFIEGDNLEVLKLLQKSYNDKVKLIYIDPPYNTGNDFVYQDDFSDPVKHYLEVTGQVDAEGNRLVANVETTGRKHSNWLNMMYSRLSLARNLLTDDGVIFVSIDENEISSLTSLLNEIFGEENKIGIISVVNNLKGRSDAKNIATAHEYLAIYSRGEFETLGLPLAEEITETYKHEDMDGRRFRLLPLRKSGTNSLRADRPNMYFPLYVDKTTGAVSVHSIDGYVEVFPLFPDGKEGRWRWGKETASRNSELLVGKESTGGSFNIQVKDFLERDGETRRSKPKSIWIDPKFTSDLGTYQIKEILGSPLFDHPKPLGLLEEILEISVLPGDLVMDFFAGSGSMGHAVLLANAKDNGDRKFILVTLNEPTSENSIAKKNGFKSIPEITKLRLTKALNTVPGAKAQGLRCLTLGKTSFGHTTPLNDGGDLFLFKETLDSTSTDDEIVSEVLLKTGVTLDQPWNRKTVCKTPVVISGGVAVALARKVTDELVQELLKEDAHLVVFLEDAFQNADDVKANAHFAFKRSNKTMKTM